MDILQIGLLLPSSTILPMGKNFERGFKDGLREKAVDSSVEIVKEFIGQGSVKQTEDTVAKLFNYDDVDLIVGVLSNRLVENIAVKFNSSKKLLLASNLGENIPSLERLPPYVFTNSLNLWQHAWSIGYWGVKTFGNRGMYVSSVYDAGYSFSGMFHHGMKAADAASEWSFSVSPMPPAGQLSDLSVIFPFLEQYQPDFVFATFCGTEATLFLNEFISRGWHKRTKLIGLPYLLEPFAPINGNITVYSSSMGTKDPFYQFGHQTATLIGEAIVEGNKSDVYEYLKQAKKIVEINGSYFLEHQANGNQVTIMQNSIVAGCNEIESVVVEQIETLPLKSDNALAASKEINIGWMNAYLCI